MTKILVVCYSYTGTSLQLARELCTLQGWRKADIALAQPRRGRSGYWRCVLDSVLRRKPRIRYDGPAPSEFDALVLVSPIWAFRLASPMRSFLAQHRDQLPEVAVISVMGGAGARNAVSEVGRLIGRLPIRNAAFTMQEVEETDCHANLQSFADALRTALASNQRGPVAGAAPQVT
jgi:hypothetical protein